MKWLRFAIFVLALGPAAGAARADDDTHLDRMTRKLKKQCEDQGGQFVLQSAEAKHTAAAMDAPVAGHPADHSHGLSGQPDLGGTGQTAFQASGECVTTLHYP